MPNHIVGKTGKSYLSLHMIVGLPSSKLLVRVVAVGVALMVFFAYATSTHGQAGACDADTEASHAMELGQLYEQIQDWDTAIVQYQAATVSKLPQCHQEATAALRRVLARKSDPAAKFAEEIGNFVYWLGNATVKVIILGLFALFAVIVIIRVFKKDNSLSVLPFTDLTNQSPEAGTLIAEAIVNTLHQAQLVYTASETSGILSLSGEVDLPRFSSQAYNESLTQSLTALNALNVGGIGLPVGSIVESVFNLLTSGKRRITGSYQRYGTDSRIIARLEEGYAHECKQIWQIDQNSTKADAGNNLSPLADSLGFEILFSLGNGWGTKSAKSLEHFTYGVLKLRDPKLDSASRHVLEEAVRHFEEAIIIDPTHSLAKYNLALAHIGLGNYEQAISILTKMRHRSQGELEPEIAYNLGIAYYNKATDYHYEFAEQEFQRVIEILTSLSLEDSTARSLKRKELLALTHCGLALVNAQQISRDELTSETHYQEAKVHSETALRMMPSNSEVKAIAYSAMGVASSNRRNYMDAIKDLNQVVELKPDYWRAYVYLGRAQMASGDLDKAIESLEQAAALNPNYHYTQYQLGQAYRKRADQRKKGAMRTSDLDRAAESYGKAKGIAPAHDELGRIYGERGEYEKALAEFRETVKINSKYSAGWVDWVWYTLEAGVPDDLILEECRKNALRALQLDKGQPSEAHTTAVLARVYLDSGKYSKAEEEIRRSIKLNPHQTQAYYYLGFSLGKQGRYQEARDVLIDLIERHSKDEGMEITADLWRTKATTLIKQISEKLTREKEASSEDVQNSEPQVTPKSFDNAGEGHPDSSNPSS